MNLRHLVTISVAAFASFGSIIAPASAADCASTITCTLTLDETDAGFSTTNTSQSGDFGTVSLYLNTTTHAVTIDVDLASGFRIVRTGFPGSFGFSDSIGGLVAIGGFSSSSYGGGTSHATSDQHFGGLGSFTDAAATRTRGARRNALQEVSFTVKGATTNLTDVNQLVNDASPAGGDALSYFVVDAFDSNTGGNLGGRTGLLGADGVAVPEPASYLAMLLAGFGVLGWLGQRRRNTFAG